MDNYRDRVYAELDDLDQRIERLNAFLIENGTTMNKEERALLMVQEAAMNTYLECLVQRIAMFDRKKYMSFEEIREFYAKGKRVARAAWMEGYAMFRFLGVLVVWNEKIKNNLSGLTLVTEEDMKANDWYVVEDK